MPGWTDAQVIVQFRAGSTGSGVSHGPKVLLLTHPKDALFRYAHPISPKLQSLSVFSIDGDIKTLPGQFVDLRAQLPSALDGFFLEIVSKREVAEHLEEGVVPASATHRLQVIMFSAHAHAFLTAGSPFVVALFQAQESILELVHSRVDK